MEDHRQGFVVDWPGALSGGMWRWRLGRVFCFAEGETAGGTPAPLNQTDAALATPTYLRICSSKTSISSNLDTTARISENLNQLFRKPFFLMQSVKNNGDMGHHAVQRRGGFQAVHFRHAEIENNHVRLYFRSALRLRPSHRLLRCTRYNPDGLPENGGLNASRLELSSTIKICLDMLLPEGDEPLPLESTLCTLAYIRLMEIQYRIVCTQLKQVFTKGAAILGACCKGCRVWDSP